MDKHIHLPGSAEFAQTRRQSVFLVLAIVLLFVVQGVVRQGSVTLTQAMNITRQASALGVVVLGQALVVLAGGIDLSVGSLVTLTNVITVAIMKGQNQNFGTAVLACLLIGVLCGAFNAFGVIKLGIAPFIMSLCSMSIMQGIYLVYTGGSPSGQVSPLLRTIGNASLFGVIPYSTIIWLLLALLMWYVLMKTGYGRKVFAIGSNETAARLCGIRTEAVRFSTYVLCSVLAVVAGLLASGYIGTTSLSIGNDYMTNSLAAVLIGGNAIEGGKGGVWGGVLGAFFMMLLFAVLTMLSIGHVGKLITQGAIIFSVVAIQNLFGRRRSL